MNNSLRVTKKLAAILLLLPLCAIASEQAPVDFSGFWTIKFNRDPAAKKFLQEIPKDAIFIDDGGAQELGEGDYGGLQLSDKAKAEIKSHNFDAEFTMKNTCVQPSVAYYMQAPFPMEIHQSDKLIVFKMEYFDMVRLIFMDGRDIPKQAPLSKNGYSVGHWEGDELVVRTERISPATLMNNGFSHSENLVLTERFKMSEDGRTLWLIQLYEDPTVFSGIAARYVAWTKKEGEYVFPYECDFSFGG